MSINNMFSIFEIILYVYIRIINRVRFRYELGLLVEFYQEKVQFRRSFGYMSKPKIIFSQITHEFT